MATASPDKVFWLAFSEVEVAPHSLSSSLLLLKLKNSRMLRQFEVLLLVVGAVMMRDSCAVGLIFRWRFEPAREACGRWVMLLVVAPSRSCLI